MKIMKIMKKLSILLMLIFLSCSSDDDSCECRLVESLGVLIPNSITDEILENTTLSPEQLEALDFECKNRKGCD